MLEQESYSSILIERRADGVVLATFNRPEKLNAVDGALHHELTTLPRDFESDAEMRALVITGAGRAFCAGGDFSPGRLPTGSRGVSTTEEGRRIVDHMLECTKPIISAVNGYAMGLGATVALFADVVVAGRSAVFADTHVAMGIGAGDRVSAEEAERIGLVSFVVDDAELLDRAIGIASRLAAGPTQAIAASKVAINLWMRAMSAQVLPMSLSAEMSCFGSDDNIEAVTAFGEKRQPHFRGREQTA
jgi:enoyl-CoA hydratase